MQQNKPEKIRQKELNYAVHIYANSLRYLVWLSARVQAGGIIDLGPWHFKPLPPELIGAAEERIRAMVAEKGLHLEVDGHETFIRQQD